jgi:hypothetical protein
VYRTFACHSLSISTCWATPGGCATISRNPAQNRVVYRGEKGCEQASEQAVRRVSHNLIKSGTFSALALFALSDRERRYIFVTTKLPEPEHPELIPTSVQVPVIVLLFTAPFSVKVSPLGLPDLTVS